MHNHLNRTKGLIRAIVGLLVAGTEVNEMMVAVVGIAEIEGAVGIEVSVGLPAVVSVGLPAVVSVGLLAVVLVGLPAVVSVGLPAVVLVGLLVVAIEDLAGSVADSTPWKCSNA
jgi:hypothetical protein